MAYNLSYSKKSKGLVMQIIKEPVSLQILYPMAEKMFGSLVKAVVDIERQIMVVDAELHADEENLLLSEGSRQKDIWGINLYPEQYGNQSWIEFDSMINLRPSLGNKSRGVEDSEIREKIIRIVNALVTQ